MPPRFRSLTPPLISILVFSAGTVGCETEASRRRAQAEEARARRQAETEPPSQETLSQIRSAAEAFMQERHPGLVTEDFTFTSLTPNLFLIGVSTLDGLGGSMQIRLSAERLRDGKDKDPSRLIWAINDISESEMKLLAERHGINQEVDGIRNLDSTYTHHHSWGSRSWLDDYLIWRYIYHRPAPMRWSPAGGFQAMPMGFRFHNPSAPITPEDAQPYRAAAAHTQGRSSVFLGGSAWKPPLASSVHGFTGQAFRAQGSSIHVSSLSRGGFGAMGRSAGARSGS